MTQMKKFCTKCGAKLEVHKVSAKGFKPLWAQYYTFSEFNAETGKKLYVNKSVCPNYKEWKTFFGNDRDNGHTISYFGPLKEGEEDDTGKS